MCDEVAVGRHLGLEGILENIGIKAAGDVEDGATLFSGRKVLDVEAKPFLGRDIIGALKFFALFVVLEVASVFHLGVIIGLQNIWIKVGNQGIEIGEHKVVFNLGQFVAQPGKGTFPTITHQRRLTQKGRSGRGQSKKHLDGGGGARSRMGREDKRRPWRLIEVEVCCEVADAG